MPSSQLISRAFLPINFPGADLDWSPHAERTLYLSQDTSGPTLISATVNGTTLVMNFNEPLGAAASLANTDFAGKKNTAATALTFSATAPAISGSTVTLTLATASSVTASDTDVLVSYTKPTSGSGNKIVDAFGNETATFTDQPVGNLLADSIPPELASTNAAVLAADGLTLTLTFSEALKTASVPDKGAFTIKATPMGGSEETIDLAAMDGVAVDGSTVVLKLARPIAHNDGSVKVTYIKPGSGSVIEDAIGNDAGGFSDQAVENLSTVPRISIVAVYPDATPGIAPPTFRITRSVGTGRLTVNIEVTQADSYASSQFTVDILPNETTSEFTRGNDYLGNTSGPLTLTVTGGDDHLPALAPNDSATLQMKVPASGPSVRTTHQQSAYSVREGELVNERVVATTGAGVAEPRASFTVSIYTEADTATINSDYNHIAGFVNFPVGGWTATGDGAYTQTRPPDIRMISALDDDEHEADETFKLYLWPTPGVSLAIIMDRAPVTVTITDDGDALDVAGVSVTSTPATAQSAYYLAGETISFTVAIDGVVTVTGTPQFTFELGGQTRQAAYSSGSNSKALVFTYTVASGDDDHNGISWSANGLNLNGGTIRFSHSDPALQINAQLGHAGQGALADHKVDATKPTLVSARVNRTRMTLTFSEELNPTGPAASAFTVKVDGGTGVAPTALAVSGRVVTLTLATSVPHDQTVTVSYALPTTNKLQDRSGKEVDTFTDAEVNNDSFMLDCSDSAAVWCADLGFSDRTAENWGWAYLRYGEGWDPPASLSDEGFRFRGVNYTVRTMELRPGTHPSMPNAWSRWQQGYSHFSIGIFWNQARGSPSREHYQDWVLHLDGLELPFKDALRHGASFIWVGAEIQEVFNDWTPSTVNMIGIEEVAAADQETNPLLPWAPMQVDAPPQGPNRLLVVWAKPAWYFTGLPAPTKYIVQWKLASASWDNSAVVSEREVAAGSNFHSLTIDGLTEDALYSVRVIAGNDAGNGPPSEETLGRPQDDSPQLIAQTINGDRLTLRFSNRLSTGSVPVGTAFTVLADGGLIEVDSVAIRGNEVVLTLGRAVTAAAHSVKVRYDKPTDPSGVFLQDIGDNHAHIRQHHELLEVVNIMPEASVQPLTARFANEPTNHNGRDDFTFDIEFSEPVWVAIGFPRDDMLEVAGGTVVSAPWRERRSDAITFHVRPDTMGDIVIVLPGNQVCEGIIGHTDRRIEPVAGAPCAIGNRKLTNSLTMTVPGPLSTAHQVLENTPAQGQPLIEGIPEPGQTLSANTNTITDADGLENTVFRYQWLADDAESNGATGATYTVESGDVSRAIRVRVTFTDDAGHEETLTSAPTVVAAGLQLGSAAVDGATMKLTYNEELDTGVTLSTTAFAVEVNGSSRSLIGVGVGQSNVLLLLNPAVEAGDTVTVDYTAPDGPDFIRDIRGRKAASFSGQAVTNDTASAPLTATIHDAPSSHNGQDAFTFELRFSEDPQPDFSYTTVRDHAFTVTGGSVTYVRRLEPGKNVRWEITVAPGSSAAVAMALNATTDCSAQGAICTEDGGKLSGGTLLVVPGPNTPATGLPSITGTAQVGENLTADATGISDGDGLDNATFTYQWLADDVEINGATASTYTLADADEGKAIKVRVSFTDDADNDEQLTSAGTGAVAAAPPPPNTSATGLPAITGTAQVGETLTAGTTGISDGDGLDNAAFAYQWLADDVEINEATGSTYTLADADEGKAITVRVSFTDDAENDEQLNSAATGAVAAAPPPPNTPATGLPTISGTAQVGETLTAGTTGISDGDGLGNATFSYQWLADDAEINGATGSTYTLADADEGKAITVRVSFTDDAENDEVVTSAGTGAVAAAPPPPNAPATGLPTIAGTAQVGETLTADTTGISDGDGLGNAAFAHQWLADDVEINGATESTYTLADADEGKAITVRVSFTDDAGNDEQITSAATGTVAAAVVNPPLMASAGNVPSSHDGSATFLFELRFSEELVSDFSYVAMRDHVLTVTGGSVTYVRRLGPPSNIGWEIHVTPDSDGPLIIVLPVTGDCGSDGAICTEDGRMLSNRLEFTVNGP